MISFLIQREALRCAQPADPPGSGPPQWGAGRFHIPADSSQITAYAAQIPQHALAQAETSSSAASLMPRPAPLGCPPLPAFILIRFVHILHIAPPPNLGRCKGEPGVVSRPLWTIQHFIDRTRHNPLWNRHYSTESRRNPLLHGHPTRDSLQRGTRSSPVPPNPAHGGPGSAFTLIGSRISGADPGPK